MKKIFATGNQGKFQKFIASIGDPTWEKLSLEIMEIQGSSAQAVAEDKCLKAWKLAECTMGDLVIAQDNFYELLSTPNWPGCSMANTKSWQVDQWLALVDSLPTRDVVQTVAVTLYDGIKLVTTLTVHKGIVGYSHRGNSGSVLDKLVIWENESLTISELEDKGIREPVNYPV